jgi:peroxidase
MRFGHVIVKDDNHQANADCSLGPVIDIEDVQFISSTYISKEEQYQMYSRSLLCDNTYVYTPQVNGQMNSNLFKGIFGPGKTSLPSLNNQRCRDHGVRSYVEYREFCGLPVPENFDDLRNVMRPDTIAKLKKHYRHVRDIDLWTGGVSEKSAASYGKFFCIILV